MSRVLYSKPICYFWWVNLPDFSLQNEEVAIFWIIHTFIDEMGGDSWHSSKIIHPRYRG